MTAIQDLVMKDLRINKSATRQLFQFKVDYLVAVIDFNMQHEGKGHSLGYAINWIENYLIMNYGYSKR